MKMAKQQFTLELSSYNENGQETTLFRINVSSKLLIINWPLTRNFILNTKSFRAQQPVNTENTTKPTQAPSYKST